MLRFLTCLALTLALPVHAQNAGLDPRFGVGGMVSLREPTATNARNLGMAACTAPGGGLTVVAATTEDQLAMWRLSEDGSLDGSFAGDGLITLTVPPSPEDNVQSACMPDGRIVLSRMAPGVGSDKNMQLIRVTPDGELDTTFGVGGVRVIDFDIYQPGLGDLEYPLALNLVAGNELLLSTRTYLSDGSSRPGIVRVDASGNIVYARLVTVPGMTASYASGAGIATDGHIWIVGGGNPTNQVFVSWFRCKLHAGDGATSECSVGTEGNYVVDGGRMLANGTMVAVGKYVPQSQPGGAYQPRLLVFRDNGTSAVVLPALTAVNNSAPTLSPFPGDAVAIPTSDGHVLAMSPMGGQNQEWHLATYAAQIQLGASAAEDRVETRFASNGAKQFSYSAAAPCANGSPPLQRMVRASNWRGRPILVGIHATTCANNPRDTMVARLLTSDDIYYDGFGR
jgi:hypothetical protein